MKRTALVLPSLLFATSIASASDDASIRLKVSAPMGFSVTAIAISNRIETDDRQLVQLTIIASGREYRSLLDSYLQFACFVQTEPTADAPEGHFLPFFGGLLLHSGRGQVWIVDASPRDLTWVSGECEITEEKDEGAPVGSPDKLEQSRQPEVTAWNIAVMRHIRSVWITPPEFRGSGLTVQLEVDLAADGSVLGSPMLVRSSGNPFLDDNAIRAITRASPLPPPPKAGRRTLTFSPEE